MKLLDKFLKILKTDRNTFLTYVLTLISFYLVIDRLIEILFIKLLDQTSLLIVCTLLEVQSFLR